MSARSAIVRPGPFPPLSVATRLVGVGLTTSS